MILNMSIRNSLRKLTKLHEIGAIHPRIKFKYCCNDKKFCDRLDNEYEYCRVF